MTSFRLDRIALMIECLENLPPERGLDLSRFAQRDDRHPCGTVACALGWSALYPPLMEQGFVLMGYDHSTETNRPVKSLEDMKNFSVGSFFASTVLNEAGDPMGCGDVFFGFPAKWVDAERNDLWADHFLPRGYRHLGRPPTAQDVADKLRKTFNLPKEA